MNQSSLIDKADRLRNTLSVTGDKLLISNKRIPGYLKSEYDALSNQIESIENIAYRVLSDDSIDWCVTLLSNATARVNEFNFIVALYNNKEIL